MGTFTIVRDLSASLKSLMYERLNEPTEEVTVNEGNIIFDSPADIVSGATSPTQLSIFLYQIVQNSYQRNSEWESIGINQRQHPPLILDLYYLFTPYSNDKVNEFIMLEKIMMIFHENAVLKGEVLKESLQNSPNEIRVVPHSFSFDEINKLWERFPNKPFKLSLAYMLTPVCIPSDQKESITRVTEKVLDVYSLGDQK